MSTVNAFYLARTSADFAVEHLGRVVDVPAKAIRIRPINVVNGGAVGMTEVSVDVEDREDDAAIAALADVGAWTVTKHQRETR